MIKRQDPDRLLNKLGWPCLARDQTEGDLLQLLVVAPFSPRPDDSSKTGVQRG